jgi:hypothetical protein
MTPKRLRRDIRVYLEEHEFALLPFVFSNSNFKENFL